MFWGLLLEEGKFYSQKVTKPFHVSMAALEPSGKGGNPVTVNLEQDGMDFILCTLKEETLYQQAVDLNFAQNDEIKFFLSGKGTVHLTGYVVTEEESEDDLYEDSDDEPPELTESVAKKPKEAEKVSKKPVKATEEESEESEDESDEDSDDSDEETVSSPKTKKPAVPDKKVKGEKKPDKPVVAKKDKKAEAEEEDSDEDDSDEDESEEDDGGIDFKKLMAEVSGDDDDDDDDDIDMDEMDEDEDEEGEEEESEDDSSEEEESPPKKAKKTPPVTPNTDSSKPKKEKKTPVSSSKETPKVKEKVKDTPEPVKSGKKRKEIDSPLVNGDVECHSKKSKKDKQDKEKKPESPQVKTPKKTLKGGIIVEDLKVGTGPETVNGKYVNVYYTGKLKSNNQVFDSNTSGKGLKFRLGGNEVIKGWDVGVPGMKVGGRRRLTIPYKMAYGEKGCSPEIPPKADLVFDVELKTVH